MTDGAYRWASPGDTPFLIGSISKSDRGAIVLRLGCAADPPRMLEDADIARGALGVHLPRRLEGKAAPPFPSEHPQQHNCLIRHGSRSVSDPGGRHPSIRSALGGGVVGGLWTGTDRSVAHRRRPAQDIVPLITYGELDGVAHPFVGLMVADDADGNPMWRCSGALISPTLFLTAGHCTDGAAPVTSFALNGNCAGTGSGYRVDQADDLDWLSSLPH